MNNVVLDIQPKKNNITFGTVVLNHIQNPFDPIGSKTSRTDLHGKVLGTYLEGFCLGQEYLVTVNGKLVEDFDYVVQGGDTITYTPVVQGGGGGKDIVRLVALVALAAFAPYAAGFLLTGTFAAATGIIGAVTTMAITVAGSLLINAVLPPTTPNITGGTSPGQESNNYSWTGITTNRDLNSPIPVLYGTFALGGTVINNKFYYKGTEEWMAIQLALCHGEIKEIQAGGITINKAAYSSLVASTKDGTFKYSNGEFDQGIMTGFEDTSFNNASVSRKLDYNVPYVFTTTSTSIDRFKLHMDFPKGLYHMDQRGTLQDKTAKFRVRYRKVGDVAWNVINDEDPKYVKEYLYEVSNEGDA